MIHHIAGLIKLTNYIHHVNYLSIINLFNRADIQSKVFFFILNYIETYKVSNAANYCLMIRLYVCLANNKLSIAVLTVFFFSFWQE